MSAFIILLFWVLSSLALIFLAWGAVLVVDRGVDVWLKTLDKLADIERKRRR